MKLIDLPTEVTHAATTTVRDVHRPVRLTAHADALPIGPLHRPTGRLMGCRTIVTGGTRGIGRAIAARLCGEGAEVGVVARRESDLVATADTLRVAPIRADLTDPNAPARLAAHAKSAWGGLDILVLNAARVDFGRLEDATSAGIDALFDTNVKSAVLTVQALLPMLRRSRGQVVFINTTAIRAQETAGRGLYVASKLALKGIADALRDEVNADGVRVISVMPGTTATDGGMQMVSAAGRAWTPERLIQPDDVATLVCEALAMPRSAEVTDLYMRPFVKS